MEDWYEKWENVQDYVL